jgi:hypothetical protein
MSFQRTAGSTAGGAAAGASVGGPVGAVIGGLGGLGMSLAGMSNEAAQRAKQRRINEAMARMYGRLYTDPAMSKDMQMKDTAFSGIAADPQSIEAQRGALNYLANVRDNKGMTSEDRAQLNRIRQGQLQTEQSQRGAIMQDAASRGMLNSGSSLAAQLNASQNQANRAQQYGLDVAAQGQARALDAAMKGGYLGSQMREQSFGEQAKIAAAQDMLQRFNRSIQQQQFANRFNVMGAQSGQQNAIGQNYIYGGERTTEGLGNIASGIGEMGKAFVGAPTTAAPTAATTRPLTQDEIARRQFGGGY